MARGKRKPSACSNGDCGGRAKNKRTPFPDSGRSRKKARLAEQRNQTRASSHDKEEDKLSNRLRLRVKRLRRLIDQAKQRGGTAISNGEVVSAAEMCCELGGVLMAMGKSRQATAQFKAAIAACDASAPSSISARQQLIVVYMDDAEAAHARALADEFADDHSCAFEFTRALLNFLAWSVLAEEGYTEAMATASLCAAISANPWAALFMVHADVFTRIVDPDFVDNLPRAAFEAVGSVDEAFKYCVEGLSMWADCDGAIKWLTAKVRADLPIEALVESAPAEKAGSSALSSTVTVPTPAGSRKSVALFQRCVRNVAKGGGLADVDSAEEEDGEEELVEESEDEEGGAGVRVETGSLSDQD